MVNGVYCDTLQISIHALREEGDQYKNEYSNCQTVISIHALREEGDQGGITMEPLTPRISIHALREEGDL